MTKSSINITGLRTPQLNLDRFQGRLVAANLNAPHATARDGRFVEPVITGTLPYFDISGAHFVGGALGGNWSRSIWTGTRGERMARLHLEVSSANMAGFDFGGIVGDEMTAIPVLELVARGTVFDGCDAAGHDWRHCVFDARTSCEGGNMSGCDLRSLPLAGMNFRFADLRGVDARGSIWADEVSGPADVTGARLDGIVVESSVGWERVTTDDPELTLIQQAAKMFGLGSRFQS